MSLYLLLDNFTRDIWCLLWYSRYFSHFLNPVNSIPFYNKTISITLSPFSSFQLLHFYMVFDGSVSGSVQVPWHSSSFMEELGGSNWVFFQVVVLGFNLIRFELCMFRWTYVVIFVCLIAIIHQYTRAHKWLFCGFDVAQDDLKTWYIISSGIYKINCSKVSLMIAHGCNFIIKEQVIVHECHVPCQPNCGSCV